MCIGKKAGRICCSDELRPTEAENTAAQRRRTRTRPLMPPRNSPCKYMHIGLRRTPEIMLKAKNSSGPNSDECSAQPLRCSTLSMKAQVENYHQANQALETSNPTVSRNVPSTCFGQRSPRMTMSHQPQRTAAEVYTGKNSRGRVNRSKNAGWVFGTPGPRIHTMSV